VRNPDYDYRGVRIRYSDVIFCETPGNPQGCYVAQVGDWMFVGTLESVKEHIDERLENRRGLPGSLGAELP
jgi:hypothetical protein